MFSAEQRLTHNPGSSFACFTDIGKIGAQGSNIALGIHGIRAVDAYIDDDGPSNTAAGHRRWLLSPRLHRVAVGDVPATSSRPAANALFVLGLTGSRPRNPLFIAWPSAGFFPHQLLPRSRRWSFAVPTANFHQASVQVFRNGQPVTITVYPPSRGADPALVWEMPHIPESDRDVVFQVLIEGFQSQAEPDFTSAQYSVTVFSSRER